MTTILEAYPDGVFTKIVYWDEVEGKGAEEYDESFLASLRDELKHAEKNDEKYFIAPMRCSKKAPFWGDAPLNEPDEARTQDAELFDQFTACMVHVARRIKDCKSVVGFALPDFTGDWSLLCGTDDGKTCKEQFVEAFQKKHSHYIFVHQSN